MKMCGIAGAISPRPISPQILERVSDALAHRGPDDKGLWHGDGVTFVHRRLSILDLEGGHQPMRSEDGTLVVVFNGELYNFPQLRRDLEAKGRRFRTRCDTEVLLHLYAEYGPDFVRQLRGMFAFTLWDSSERLLVMARDHLGQKPLFYWASGETFLFASEVKALLAFGYFEATVDLTGLFHYMSLRFCPGDLTLFSGVKKLEPGHLLLLRPDQGTTTVTRYWNLDYTKKLSLSFEEAVEQLSALLDRVVREHLQSDVPVGTLLSGGVDSSLVTMVASRHAPMPLSTFSVGVKDSDFSELPFARRAAAWVGTQHREFVIESDLLTLLPDIVWHMEEPADPHAIGYYLTSQLASKYRKVVLSGDGGDEVFGGYLRYSNSPWLGAYSALPRSVRLHLLAPVLQWIPERYSYSSLATKARWIHEMSFLNGAARYYHTLTFFRFPETHRLRLFTPAAQQRLQGPDSFAWISRHYNSRWAHEAVDRMLYADQMTRLPEHYLQIADRMSMAHGLELRPPLIDLDLVEFSARLPSTYKIRQERLKVILREAARRHFPARFLARSKQGFGLPIGRWFRGSLVNFVRHVVQDSKILETGFLHRDYILELMREHLAGRCDHSFRIWSLLNVELWYRLFFLGEEREDVRSWLHDKLGRTTGRVPEALGVSG